MMIDQISQDLFTEHSSRPKLLAMYEHKANYYHVWKPKKPDEVVRRRSIGSLATTHAARASVSISSFWILSGPPIALKSQTEHLLDLLQHSSPLRSILGLLSTLPSTRTMIDDEGPTNKTRVLCLVALYAPQVLSCASPHCSVYKLNATCGHASDAPNVIPPGTHILSARGHDDQIQGYAARDHSGISGRAPIGP